MSRRWLGIAALVAVVLAMPYQSRAQQLSWFRGNTHTHTWNSTGDSAPDDVAKWYRQHGYDFIFITDQDTITDVSPLNALFGGNGQFLVIRGEEVASNRPDTHVHVNSLNPKDAVHAVFGGTPRETLQKDIDLINSAGGVAQINHPNFLWQLKADDISAARGVRLLEIMNMHPLVNSVGAGPDFPSAESIWDQVLSRGVVMWGVASDDMHELRAPSGGDSTDAEPPSLPGRGWIVLRAAQLTVEDIMAAITKGDFYASTGVQLSDYKVSGKEITIAIKASGPYQTKYRTQFLGKGGRTLQDTTANPATYEIKGDEFYVRARITDSNGNQAWTQPVFVK